MVTGEIPCLGGGGSPEWGGRPTLDVVLRVADAASVKLSAWRSGLM
jgi:hypothetical protein